jgi:hypothetical protein
MERASALTIDTWQVFGLPRKRLAVSKIGLDKEAILAYDWHILVKPGIWPGPPFGL